MEQVVLDSGKLKLVFGTDGSLKSLSDGSEWLTGGGSLWKLDFRGTDGVTKEVASSDAALDSPFKWQVPLGDKSAEVTMTIRLDKGSPISYWSLKAKLPEGWKVIKSDFPIIPNIALTKGLKAAAPAGWGVEYEVKPGMSYGGTYPSCSAAMQFVAFYNRGRGLYVGAHDPQANHKHLGIKADEQGASFTCTNFPAIPEKGGGTYKVPFEAAIGVFTGDYYDAAQIYREFTFACPWSKAGPVSKRPIPQWLKDTDLWLRPRGTPEDNLEVTKQALKYFDVQTACHWYDWHVIPYDTLYPEYFPPKPGFAEAVKELQDMGTHVMPYINGRLCDPNSKTWTDEKGSQSAARRENGEPYTEVYGSKVPLNAMCPYTDQWQDKIAGLVDRLMNEVGVHGVYIDQIGAAYPVECFDPHHGHPIGGGHFWVDGYRKLLEKVRARLPKDRMITTEEDAECWIDQFDALLLVNTPSTSTPIPLFPAVYSGRTITFGFLYIPADDLEKSLPWRVKMARCFLYGAQLGWIQPKAIMAPEAAKEAEFLRNLAHCRSKAHDFLAYGKFLGLVPVKGDNPRMKGEGSGSFGGSYKIDLPSVMASAWCRQSEHPDPSGQSEDGRTAIALVNMSDEAREVEVKGRKVLVPARDAVVLATR
ncbi:MAG TPA: DUF6259 domain-containing protein [Armatimonadota bacterium]|nr:DUF6259 domain-containing protein [Armatimonadota bacterium]